MRWQRRRRQCRRAGFRRRHEEVAGRASTQHFSLDPRCRRALSTAPIARKNVELLRDPSSALILTIQPNLTLCNARM